MKYAILGDIHGNLEALEAVLKKAGECGVDRYVCIGDIVGYNANPHECLEIVRNLPNDGIVRGNHDEYVSNSQELIGFNPQAASAVHWTRDQLTPEEHRWLANLPFKLFIRPDVGQRFQIVHATLDNPEKWGYIFDRFSAEACMRYQASDVCFFGHTHTPMYFVRNDEVRQEYYEEIQVLPNHKYLVNVGSVGQPRDGNPQAALVVYDTAAARIYMHRVDYDIEKCQRKIAEAGLPERLSERLAIGR